MKKSFKNLALLLTCTMAVSGMTGCATKEEPPVENQGVEENAPVAVPAEVQAVKDKVTKYAADYAKKLDGDWADKHVALIAAGDGRENPGYQALLDVLVGMQEECGAYYVYALISESPDAEAFQLTVDASPEPDDWMYDYEWEMQFKEALEGTPAAARSAWDDSEDDLCWSAFAPIHDSEGNIVAILGIDYPAPEILDFPQWNRDAEQWNGITE